MIDVYIFRLCLWFDVHMLRSIPIPFFVHLLMIDFYVHVHFYGKRHDPLTLALCNYKIDQRRVS